MKRKVSEIEPFIPSVAPQDAVLCILPDIWASCICRRLTWDDICALSSTCKKMHTMLHSSTPTAFQQFALRRFPHSNAKEAEHAIKFMYYLQRKLDATYFTSRAKLRHTFRLPKTFYDPLYDKHSWMALKNTKRIDVEVFVREALSYFGTIKAMLAHHNRLVSKEQRRDQAYKDEQLKYSTQFCAPLDAALIANGYGSLEASRPFVQKHIWDWLMERSTQQQIIVDTLTTMDETVMRLVINGEWDHIAAIGCDTQRMRQKYSEQIARLKEADEVLLFYRLPRWKVLVKNEKVVANSCVQMDSMRYWIRTGWLSSFSVHHRVGFDIPQTFCETLTHTISQIRAHPEYKE